MKQNNYLFILLIALCSNFINANVMFNNCKIIDLTHTLHAGIPTWDGSCGFNTNIIFDYDAKSATQFRGHSLHFAKAGTGTHMDAPRHCFKNLASIAEIEPEKFILACYVIDVVAKASSNYLISADDILEFEAIHGTIKENSIVIGYTGWSRFWKNPLKYRNSDPDNIMHFPAFSPQAIELLIKRKIQAVGIDTLSPDDPANSDYPVHRLLLSQGKYILENLANCDQLPASGSYIIALPIKIAEGTEAPIRALAFVPNEGS